MIFQEVSAKTGKDINELFTNYIYNQIAEKFKLKPIQQPNLSLANPSQETNENNKNDESNKQKNINLGLNTQESNNSEFRTRSKCCNK